MKHGTEWTTLAKKVEKDILESFQDNISSLQKIKIKRSYRNGPVTFKAATGTNKIIWEFQPAAWIKFLHGQTEM